MRKISSLFVAVMVMVLCTQCDDIICKDGNVENADKNGDGIPDDDVSGNGGGDGQIMFSDLSQYGCANCYIVDRKGNYRFRALKGNSQETIGPVASVDVLWESFGTEVSPNIGDLISYVDFDDDYILFKASGLKGNALIAARNNLGIILWSWHIWMTDQPADQVYNNNAGIMMDRNLGATSAEPGDVRSLGLLYQWGRKDPFMCSSSVSSGKFAASTIIWPSPIETSVSTGTIEYAVANPTRFIIENEDYGDWNCFDGSMLWNKNKTIYDPCPPGYRIPDGGKEGIWAKAFGFSEPCYEKNCDNLNKGFNLGASRISEQLTSSSQDCWYPFAGSRLRTDGTLYGVGESGYYWSCTYDEGHFMLLTSDGDIYPESADIACTADALSVRCLKE